MSDFQPGYSRSAVRGRKRKQNRLLNLLIAIVIILILIVGFSIFHPGGGSQTADQSTHSSSNGTNNSGGNNGSGGAATTGNSQKNKDQTSNSDSSNAGGQSSDQGTAGTDQQSSTNQGTTGSDQQAASGDNQNSGQDSQQGDHQLTTPQGPWQPVGTSQSPPHHTSYQQGTEDWKEQMQALYEATGLTADNSTLWWIERGGQEKTVAYMASKDKPHAFYIVHIEWVDQKGWKPTSVDRKYIKDPHAWYENKKSQ